MSTRLLVSDGDPTACSPCSGPHVVSLLIHRHHQPQALLTYQFPAAEPYEIERRGGPLTNVTRWARPTLDILEHLSTSNPL